MRVAECYCNDCRTEFKIKTKRGIPPWDIVCPCCGSTLIDYIKINGD